MAAARQRPRNEDLEEHDLTRARIRMAHLLEVETGYRSGSQSWARPGEPRVEYDPEQTTLTERRRAKVAELKDLDRQEAKQLGLEWISERWLLGFDGTRGEQVLTTRDVDPDEHGRVLASRSLGCMQRTLRT
ncbi:hypothetical protein [Streptomyces sp. NPDC007172]|uniref:hypothetical protein n=1 Tax=Streptomyces sp. NPDC007172 TaxID=3364776 RepID=UPI00368E02CE